MTLTQKALQLTRLVLLAASALLIAGPIPSIAQGVDPTVRLLQRLADAPGPPGAEDAVRAIIVEEMKGGTTVP